MTPDSVHLHCAPWVAPVCQPMLSDGAVALCGQTIVAVGKQTQLASQFPQAQQTSHDNAVLIPTLINAHIHLELSHLAELTAQPQHGTFTQWISRLLTLREHLGAVSKAATEAALQTAHQQYNTGVSVLADIGNTQLGIDLAASFPGLLLPFKEYLGLAAFTLEKNLLRLQQEPPESQCTGHAPYSTHPRLLQQLKQRAQMLGHVFPIHTAEIAAEGTMLGQGHGEMVEFVRQRGFWDGSFIPDAGGETGSIHYLGKLGVLDKHTLCVHGVYVSEAEIELLAATQTKLCLCPGSNRFLGVGKAPVKHYLEHGILPALGTDSLASNPEVSIWREMQLLSEDHPEIDHHAILAMATQGGALALGVANDCGTLSPGKKADILAVQLPSTPWTTKKVLAYLVQTGSRIRPTRILGA